MCLSKILLSLPILQTDKWLLILITPKIVGEELLQEIWDFDWLRKHVLQIYNAR